MYKQKEKKTFLKNIPIFFFSSLRESGQEEEKNVFLLFALVNHRTTRERERNQCKNFFFFSSAFFYVFRARAFLELSASHTKKQTVFQIQPRLRCAGGGGKKKKKCPVLVKNQLRESHKGIKIVTLFGEGRAAPKVYYMAYTLQPNLRHFFCLRCVFFFCQQTKSRAKKLKYKTIKIYDTVI